MHRLCLTCIHQMWITAQVSVSFFFFTLQKHVCVCRYGTLLQTQGSVFFLMLNKQRCFKNHRLSDVQQVAGEKKLPGAALRRTSSSLTYHRAGGRRRERLERKEKPQWHKPSNRTQPIISQNNTFRVQSLFFASHSPTLSSSNRKKKVKLQHAAVCIEKWSEEGLGFYEPTALLLIVFWGTVESGEQKWSWMLDCMVWLYETKKYET